VIARSPFRTFFRYRQKTPTYCNDHYFGAHGVFRS